MLTPSPSRRSGFTLAEVLVAFTIIAMLAAVIVPTVRGRIQDAYESALVSELENLRNAIAAYRQDVGKYPPALDYLTALRASPVDRCSVPLTAAAQANWRGPYLSRQILNSVGYVVAQKDTITDVLTSSASPAGLVITLSGPDTTTAHNMDIRIDGFANNAIGGFKWTAPGTDAVISYIIPTRAGAC